jgi:aminopeptidase N
VPLDVEVTTEEGVETYRILIDADNQDFAFRLPSEPRMVIFDKGDWILKTLDFPKTAEELAYQIRNGDYISRVHAAQALGGKGSSPEAVPALLEALQAPGHFGLGREAALSLGKIGTEEAREALLQGILVENARVRMSCAEALGEFRKDERAANALLRLLRTDPAYGVREKAVESLVAMESKHAASACREALKQESDRSIVRNAGLNGLVELGDTDALDLIRNYASAGNDRNHRQTAITAYAKLARELEGERARERAADFLEDMLDDWYLGTRRTVISALGTLGEESAVASLRRAQNNDPLERLRRQARRTADRLEAGKDTDDGIQTMETQIRDLENKIEAMEKAMEELKGKTAEKPVERNAP